MSWPTQGRSRGDHVVRQDDRERLVADQLLGHQHGVPEAQLLLLADVADLDHVADLADAPEHLDVALGLEQVLQLVAVVEVVLDRPLLAAGDDDDLLDAGSDGLLDRVLDDGLVDERQHLLGLRLGGGQEAGPPPGGREDGFADAHRTSSWKEGSGEPPRRPSIPAGSPGSDPCTGRGRGRTAPPRRTRAVFGTVPPMAAWRVRQGVALLLLVLLLAGLPASAASPAPSADPAASVAPGTSPAPVATPTPTPRPLALPSLVPVAPLVEPGPALTREVVAYLPYWVAQHDELPWDPDIEPWITEGRLTDLILFSVGIAP